MVSREHLNCATLSSNFRRRMLALTAIALATTTKLLTDIGSMYGVTATEIPLVMMNPTAIVPFSQLLILEAFDYVLSEDPVVVGCQPQSGRPMTVMSKQDKDEMSRAPMSSGTPSDMTAPILDAIFDDFGGAEPSPQQIKEMIELLKTHVPRRGRSSSQSSHAAADSEEEETHRSRRRPKKKHSSD